MIDLAHLQPQITTPELRAMIDAAGRAGAMLQYAFHRRQSLKLTEKTAGDFVSEADEAAEAEIADVLNKAYPTYGWLGEESGARPGRGTTRQWVVDPLDGTTNFLKGLPHWAISIGLCDGEEPLAGLIYDPEKGELFTAMRGLGAYLNGIRVEVSTEMTLRAALFATGVPAGGRVTYLRATLEDLNTLMPLCAGIRRNGAAALDLAYVAAGRLDGYWERNLGVWDIAAGVLMVQEAGGVVAPLWKGRSVMSSGSFVAGTGAMVPCLLANISN